MGTIYYMTPDISAYPCYQYILNGRVNTQDEVLVRLVIKQYHNNYITIRAKVDTGAHFNVLPYIIYNILIPTPPLITAPSTLLAYGQQPIKLLGITKLSVSYHTTYYDIDFYVAQTQGPVTIGYLSCIDMSLVTMNCAIETIPNPLILYHLQ